jgi:hypothetical protein
MFPSFIPPAAKRLIGLIALSLGFSATAAAQTRVLFVGNSFTHGQYAPVLNYNFPAVTDLNYGLPATDPRAHDPGMPARFGGIPGIFKKFTTQAGLNYDVQIEAISGKTLQYHHTNALSVIAQPGWDKVVLQEQSNRPVPTARGGNWALFYDYATRLETAVHGISPATQLYLYQTWARPDFTYPAGTAYFGLPIDSMTQDLHRAYYRAASTNGQFAAVAPVGDAFLTAITTGVAMRNPYTPDPTKINLWAVDQVHPSKWGSYLSACVLFYQLTDVDPRTLGGSEQVAVDMSITPTVAVALQEIAYQQVNAAVTATAELLPNRAPLDVWPNPAQGSVRVAGLVAGQVVGVYNALGQQIATAVASAAGTLELALPAQAPAGMYVVRAGAQSRWLAVQ